MERDEYAAMDATEDAMWWYRALHARLIAALDMPVGARVIDLGCGTGGLLARLRATRPDLIVGGLEWDGPAAARAATKSGAPMVRGGVASLPFATACADAAILADVLSHHAVDPATALAEVARILRSGGRLVVNLPAYAWLMSAHDRRVGNARRYSRRQARALLLAAGFVDVRATYWNAVLLPVMIVRRLGRDLIGRESRSDVAVFPPWLDAILLRATEIERVVRWPFGGSVLLTATRP